MQNSLSEHGIEFHDLIYGPISLRRASPFVDLDNRRGYAAAPKYYYEWRQAGCRIRVWCMGINATFRIRTPPMRIVAVVAALLVSFTVTGEEPLPYRIEDGLVDESTYIGWRLFHSTCHGCHGVDATGTTVAPNLVEQVGRLSPREFTTKVLSRYRITVSASAAGSDNKTELREQFINQVLRRESGEVLMPAWERDRNVKPHVLDLYAYLRARADGALAPGRPEKKSESDSDR